MKDRYRGVRQLKDVESLRAYIDSLGIDLGTELGPELGTELAVDDAIEAPDGPLAQPLQVGDATVGNRFCVLPMEGWDGTVDGRPTDLTRRRWRRFGASGAKLIWGGEAVAVSHDGRANPNQLVVEPGTVDDLAELRRILVSEHERGFGTSDDLLVGLQLTHSGRYARPRRKDGPEPRVAYRHPLLDDRVGLSDDSQVMTDADLDALAEAFVAAAALAAEAGFHFVDVKHCHGYLGHELLSAFDRPGPYGGSFENRTRFLRQVVAGIRAAAPALQVGVRLSAVDFMPFAAGSEGVGEPAATDPAYHYAFGGDGTGLGIDLTEPKAFMDLLRELGIPMACVTVGSPYYNPHIQRPALFPPSDGYSPPEDPLVGVARQLAVTAALKHHAPDIVVVGSGYSYLQEWLGHVAQRQVRAGNVDSVGVGRMALSYPELPAEILAGRALDPKRICRTLSDCTTAPRNGLVSGCYPLDDFYADMPERRTLALVKKDQRAARQAG